MRTHTPLLALLLVIAPARAEVTVHYQFDEDIGGAVEDLSGHGLLPAVQVTGAGENAWVHTAEGAGLRIMAGDDHVSVPFAALNVARGSVRMDVWLRDLDGDQVLWRIYAPGGDGMSLTVETDGEVMLAYYKRSHAQWHRITFSARLIEPERWHEIEASWDFDGHLSLGLDGQTQAVAPLPPDPHFAEDSVMLFGNSHAGGRPMRGAIRSIVMTDQPGEAAAERRAVMEPGAPVTWRHDHIAITFDDRYGSVLSGEIGGHQLLDADEPLPLWEIDLRSEMGRSGQPLLVSAADAPPPHMSADGNGWRLEWRDVPLRGDDATLSVTAHVAPGPEPGMTSWRIEVENPSQTWGLWSIEFPMVTLRPLGERAAEHELLMPLRWGAAQRDPFGAGDSSPAARRYRSNFPGGHMQFVALTSPDSGAAYFATYDPACNSKENWLIAYPDRLRAEYRLKQFPPNLGVPREGYVQAWPAVIGHVDGDWFDVCRAYRRWAVEQPWCARGPVAARNDVPDWYRRSTVALRHSGWSDNPLEEPSVTNSLAFAAAVPGPNMGVWYDWHEVDRSASGMAVEAGATSTSQGAGWPWTVGPGVPEAVAALRGAGVYPTAYVNTRVFDPGDSDDHPQRLWALPFVIRDVYGEPDYYNRELNLWDLCPFTQGWRDRYVSNCLEAMRAGFKGIYLDSFGRGKRPCFATEHGHSRGGGSYTIDGQRMLARDVREAIRAIDPEAIMTAEANVEAFIDVLDGKLFHWNIPTNFAPLWTAVYHDYQLCYGRTVPMSADRLEAFVMVVGHLTAEGVQIGRIFTSPEERTVLQPEHGEMLAFLSRCAEARRTAYEYLCVGEMMRTPVVESDLPVVTGEHRGIPISLPAVKLRAWRAADGTVAHVLVNLTPDAVDLTYGYDSADYSFAAEGRHAITHLVPSLDDLAEADNGVCRRTVRLAGHGVEVAVLSPRDR